MTEVQRTLLARLAEVLYRGGGPRGVDAELLAEARLHAVSALICDDMTMIANDIRVAHSHRVLSELLDQAGVAHTLIKGTVSASYYPQPVRRALGDVDVLVKDISAARRALENAGYTCRSEKSSQHIVFSGPDAAWEVHYRCPGERMGGPEQVYLRDMTEHRTPTNLQHGLILLLHSASHLCGSGIGLRHLCDWAVFYPRVDEEMLAAYRRVGVLRFASVLTDICIRYLGGPEAAWCTGVEPAISDALLEDILTAGNLGKRDSNRIHQAKLIGSPIRKLVQSAEREFPRLMQLPMLRPVGSLAAGGLYLARVLTGRRPRPRAEGLVSGAGQRRRVYRQLGLPKDILDA